MVGEWEARAGQLFPPPRAKRDCPLAKGSNKTHTAHTAKISAQGGFYIKPTNSCAGTTTLSVGYLLQRGTKYYLLSTECNEPDQELVWYRAGVSLQGIS
jgi:hypothetical protein